VVGLEADGWSCRNWLKRRANARRLGRNKTRQQRNEKAPNSGVMILEPSEDRISTEGGGDVILKGP
jgi:hypothetical protein